MLKKNKQLLFIAIFAFVVNFLIAISGSFSHTTKLFLGVSVYFFCCKFLLSSKIIFRKEISFWIFIAPILIFQLSSNIRHYESTINSLPIHILFVLSSFTAYAYVKYSKLIVIFFIALLIWFHYLGKKIYLDYRFYNFEEKVEIKSDLFSTLTDKSGNKFTINESKLTIIDFWNSKCAPCYREFPFIDSISKIIDTSKIEILLLNIPLKGERKEKNYLLLNKFNYSFKQIFAENNRIMDSLKIYYFPTSIVIKNNVVLFSGTFKNALKRFNL
ncbi:MAG: TlpA family protein disulfide reductase [Niastella sp.]|nr:TlpA family protein disulfide reductase [Niastella sp.]